MNKAISTQKPEYKILRKAALVLRALNHSLRQQIIEMLAEDTQLTVKQIYIKLRVEQSVASQHLSILRKAGVVFTNRDGKYIYYSLNRERLSEIIHLSTKIADVPATQ
ncbi:MAG: metalloregulator ArsR/SmtB family transcription factor [Chitinophagales bacterium]|nr:helix-turn-helix transcriptional regulator [Chitinophagales bacterium]